jgi:hypothetical protein
MYDEGSTVKEARKLFAKRLKDNGFKGEIIWDNPINYTPSLPLIPQPQIYYGSNRIDNL